MLRMLAIGLLLCSGGLATARPRHHKAARKHTRHVAATRAIKAPPPTVAQREPVAQPARPAMVEQASDNEVPDRSFRH
jgi:hypothetical protein